VPIRYGQANKKKKEDEKFLKILYLCEKDSKEEKRWN